MYIIKLKIEVVYLRKKIRSFSLLFILISFWFIGSKYVNPLFLPSPKDIIKTTFTLITNGILFQSLISSFVRISIATILSVSISVTLGLIIINSKHAREIITPDVQIIPAMRAVLDLVQSQYNK